MIRVGDSDPKGLPMAQVHHVLLTCDVCGGEKPGKETVGFVADGSAYEIDLCERHAKQLRDGLAAFVAAGRRASSGRRSATRRARSAADSDRERTQAIRAWAKKKGLKVSERGRLPAGVVARYESTRK